MDIKWFWRKQEKSRQGNLIYNDYISITFLELLLQNGT